MQVVIEGVFAPRRFLDLIRDFIVFEDDGGGRVVKKMAGYHQFHAVQVAVAETLRAAELRRAAEQAGQSANGHKPGGKPAFYAGRIIRARVVRTNQRCRRHPTRPSPG
jgi:type I restriction enzyme, R subunit